MIFPNRSNSMVSLSLLVLVLSACVSSPSEEADKTGEQKVTLPKQSSDSSENFALPKGLKPTESDEARAEGCFYLGVSKSMGSDLSEQRPLAAESKLLVSQMGLFSACYEGLSLKTETYEVKYDWKANPQGLLVWLKPVTLTENAKILEACLSRSLLNFPLGASSSRGQLVFVGGPINENQCPQKEGLHRWQPGKKNLFRKRTRVLR